MPHVSIQNDLSLLKLTVGLVQLWKPNNNLFLHHPTPTTRRKTGGVGVTNVKTSFILKKLYKNCPARNQRTAPFHSLGKAILNSFQSLPVIEFNSTKSFS